MSWLTKVQKWKTSCRTIWIARQIRLIQKSHKWLILRLITIGSNRKGSLLALAWKEEFSRIHSRQLLSCNRPPVMQIFTIKQSQIWVKKGFWTIFKAQRSLIWPKVASVTTLLPSSQVSGMKEIGQVRLSSVTTPSKWARMDSKLRQWGTLWRVLTQTFTPEKQPSSLDLSSTVVWMSLSHSNLTWRMWRTLIYSTAIPASPSWRGKRVIISTPSACNRRQSKISTFQ